MKKEEIEQIVDSDLASGIGIPAVNHRNVLKDHPKSILNAIYTDVVVDTHNTSNIFQKDPDFNGEYIIRTMKIGNCVYVNGAVNKFNTGRSVFAFSTLDEFLPLKFPNFPAAVTDGDSNSNPSVSCLSNKFLSETEPTTEANLSMTDNVPGETVVFNLFYFVEV